VVSYYDHPRLAAKSGTARRILRRWPPRTAVAGCAAIDGHGNFYALRHTFQTEGDEARDTVATKKIMGHAMDEDISTTYRERISDERLRAVADHVRGWLWPKPLPAKKPAKQPVKKPRAKKQPATRPLRIYA
jgi:integrase